MSRGRLIVRVLWSFNDGGRNLLQASLCRRHPSNPLSLPLLCLVSFLNSVSVGRVASCRLGECSKANFGPKDGCVCKGWACAKIAIMNMHGPSIKTTYIFARTDLRNHKLCDSNPSSHCTSQWRINKVIS